MRRFPIAALVAGVLASALLVGCGGGGGGSSSNNNGGGNNGGTDTTTRTISGKVVSSSDQTKGVAGVNVSFGYDGSGRLLTGTTDAQGNYSFTTDLTTALPVSFEVQTAGAGSTFPTWALVKYADGQSYDPGKVDTPAGILNGVTNAMPTIVVYENNDSAPAPPYASHDTTIYGRIVRSDNGVGISGVNVSFGTPAVTAVSGKLGYFALNLGRDALAITLFPDPENATFSISTAAAMGAASTSYLVYYSSANWPQSSIPVPSSIIHDPNQTSLDVLILNLSSNDGGGGPPPPPRF